MILNIGCGRARVGDVNLDISRESFADVIADAHFLPFKEKSFNYVICSNTLEHVENPIKVLQEIKHVTTEKAVLKVPNAIWDYSNPDHLYTWNAFTFRNLVKKVFSNVEIQKTFNSDKTSITAKKLLLNFLIRVLRQELTAIVVVDLDSEDSNLRRLRHMSETQKQKVTCS